MIINDLSAHSAPTLSWYTVQTFGQLMIGQDWIDYVTFI